MVNNSEIQNCVVKGGAVVDFRANLASSHHVIKVHILLTVGTFGVS